MDAVLNFTVGVALILGLWSAAVFSKWAETRVWPVSGNWRPTDARMDGDDLVLVGLLTRFRDNCTYLPQPMARDLAGQNYSVVSTSSTAGISWTASKTPQKFGPWRVFGGANRVLIFYQSHRCHPLWDVTTELGTFDPAKELP